ncbi:hypothetical protein W822_05740 [Advenella kashmirensis W13003]|uniref:DUF4142 domain-containing protein n=2 Tax=Advenella kashmirensis TaxID=310575 RepID=V8QVH5_9BURK|nr:hypothetical protein W822_05740 [Advenella kashmirensis W13003]
MKIFTFSAFIILLTVGPLAMPSEPLCVTLASTSQDGLLKKNVVGCSDKIFLRRAAEIIHFEIEASRFVPQKAVSNNLKDFSEYLVNENLSLIVDIIVVSLEKGFSPPIEPSPVQSSQLKSLNLNTGHYEKRYVEQIGISAQIELIQIFKEAENRTSDNEIRAFTHRHLLLLERRLKKALALRDYQNRG